MKTGNYPILTIDGTPPSTAVIPRVETPPKLDGVLDDSCWAQAVVLTNFTIVGKTETTDATECRLVRDNTWLYLGFLCKNPGILQMDQKKKERDMGVGQDDSVEVFFDPGSDGVIFFQFMLSFTNVQAGRMFTQKNGRDASWKLPWRSATQAEKDGWTAEMAIPLFLIASYGDAAKVRLNMARNKRRIILDQKGAKLKEEMESSCWSPVSMRYVEPDKFRSISGFEEIHIVIPELVALEGAEVEGYEMIGDKHEYTVKALLRSYTGKGGKVVVEVRDYPLPDGKGEVVAEEVTVKPMQTKELIIHVPVASLGGRDTVVTLKKPGTGTVLRELKIKNAAVLGTEKERLGFYRDKLMVKQDRYVVFSNKDKVALQMVAKDIPRQKYQANVRIKIIDPQGNVEERKDVYRLEEKIQLVPKEDQYGFYKIILTAVDADGEKYLTNSFCFPDTESIEKLAGKTVPADPFKKAACMAVAADIERMKVAACKANTFLPAEVSKEINARLDVLEDGKLDSNNLGIYDLLALTANPEAQVVVEFNPPGNASIVFYWGSIPLASVWVTECQNAEAAVTHLDKQWMPLAKSAEKTTIEHYPSRLSVMSFELERMTSDQFDPTGRVLLVQPGSQLGLALEVAHLSMARVEAVTILPDCSPAVHAAVEAWSQKAKVPVLGLKEALTNKNIMVAGDIRLPPGADAWKTLQLYAIIPVDSINLSVAVRNRVFSVQGMPSRRLAEQVVRMVIHLKPVMSDEVDALRLELVKELAPKGEAAAIPEGLRLFCGDLHAHTFYSDGLASPAGLVLESLYCNMDFVAITDHNTIEGAQYARKLFSDYGFNYSVIVGEEITASWAHLNAYPLKEVIPWETISVHEIVKLVHRQGAVIQWNHPGYTSSKFEMSHLQTGLVDTGCDAWEHYSWRYDEWKQKGVLPVFVGGTDTHDGTFSYPERTIILAPTTAGDDVAEAMRLGRAVLVTPSGGKLFYGSDRMTAIVWAALAEGKGLKTAKAEHLQSVLKKANLSALLRASSPTRPVRLQDISKSK